VKGHVLPRDAEGTIKHVQNAKIAVFAAGIDISKTETKDTVLLKNATDLLNYSKSEEKKMEELISQIAAAGINVIVSGGSIGEMAMHFIERHKMMIVKAPSKFEIRRICKSVGATPLARLGGPTPEETGNASSVSVEELGSTKITIFKQDKDRSGISTIVVRAATPNTLDDIERAVDDGVNVFKGMMRDPRFVAGAGATEIEISRKLQAFGDATPGLAQYAIRKFGESFECVPRILAENSGGRVTEMLASLYGAHGKGNIHDGIDVTEGEIRNAVEMGVLDLLLTKQTGIRLATDTAVTILRVDQIIMAKRAGGPKPPKQGPMDADD